MSTDSLIRDRSSVFAAFGATLCYGATPVFLRYFVDYLDPWTVNGIRYTIGAIFWLPFVVILLYRRPPWEEPGQKGNVWKDALVPATVNLVAQIGWGVSPYFLEATVIGFVYKLHFLFTILFGLLLIPAERPLARNRLFQWGAALSLLGVMLMFARDMTSTSHVSLVGLAILLMSTAAFGVYAVAVRRFMEGYPARLSFGVISLYTAGGLVTLMFLVGDYREAAALAPRLWGFLLLSAVLGIAIAHVLYYRAIHGLGAILSTGLLMATPFVTMLGASLFLGERLYRLQIVGGLTVVAGSLILVLAKQVEVK